MLPRKQAVRGVIAILRPAPEGGVMAAALRRCDIPAVASPVARIRFTGRAGALNPRRFPALTLFTSPRGVAAALRRFSPDARSRLRRLQPVAGVVGPATAAAARAAGYRVIAGRKAVGAADVQRELARHRIFLGLEAGAEILVVSPERDNPLPGFLRRQGARGKGGWRIIRRADYSARAHAPGIRRIQALLRKRSLAGLIIGSPRQMEFLWRGTTPGLRPALTALSCFVPGKSTAKALREFGFQRIVQVPAFRLAALRKALAPLRRSEASLRRPIKLHRDTPL